ncbi:MAG: DNA polymerase I [Nitrospirae bacterium]|nr:MAG: DNA polymerase I [Nitrospirota bacterium]
MNESQSSTTHQDTQLDGISPEATSQKIPPKHVYLIDGSSFLFRAFHALPMLNRPDGTPINAVLGFTNMLIKLLDDVDASHIAVIFDATGESFRNELAPAYKANRPEPPPELLPQFPLVREATRAFNIACLEVPGYEADDLIATYARQAANAGAEVTIVSSDKDLMQLVSDRITLYDAIKNRRIGVEEVKEKFGVPPEKVVDVQALAGDAIDNVPGVPGIGLKTAAELINQYGDLESLLAHASEIKQAKRRQNLLDYAEQARLSRQLVQLHDDVPLEIPLTALARRDPDPEVLLKFLSDQGFKSVIAKIQNRLGSLSLSSPKPSSGWTAPDTAFRRPRYELIRNVAALQDWITRARYAGIVAVDTETTSLDESRAELVGISLCVEPGQACYIPVGHTDPAETSQRLFVDQASSAETSPPQLALDVVCDALKPLFSDPSVLKVGHNLKYDMVVLSRYGLTLTPIDDTMLLSYVLDSGSHGHGLDELADLHLGQTTVKYHEVAGSGKNQISFAHVPLDKALTYAAEDADIARRLHHTLKPRLVTEHLVTVYETLERPLIPVLVAMEQRGVKVDRGVLLQLNHEFTQRLQELEREIYTLAGHPFNIGSPKQLGAVLFEEMGLEGGQKGKSGAYVTGADVLETLALQGHALPARVLDWRQLDKLKNTYTTALVDQIHPQTGRVHTSFSMAAASTGRLSSSNPNLQNIPIRTEDGRKIRRAFVAESGHRLVSLDYSQIELRLLAHIANIEPLKEAFRNGQDIHALTASQVFGIAPGNLDTATRRKAKAINFGIIYGISPFGLSRQLGVSTEEAAAYMKAYFDQYPGIQAYMERTKQFCRERGYVQTLFGRRCHVPGIHDKNAARRNFAERAAINAPLQGSAADILKRAMIRVPKALAQEGLTQVAHLVLTVHDELVLEVEEAYVEHAACVVKTVMERAPLPAVNLDVPLTVDVGIATSWDAAH